MARTSLLRSARTSLPSSVTAAPAASAAPAPSVFAARAHGRRGKEAPQSALARSYATTASSIPNAPPQTTSPKPGPPKPNTPYTIFDRAAKQQQRDRAATRRLPDSEHAGAEGSEGRGESSRLTDYVRQAVAENVAERLLDVNRKFPTIVELGSGAGYLRHHLDAKTSGTERIIMCDTSGAFRRVTGKF